MTSQQEVILLRNLAFNPTYQTQGFEYEAILLSDGNTDLLNPFHAIVQPIQQCDCEWNHHG